MKADERLIATLMEWWFQEPLDAAANIHNDRGAALDDIHALLAHLSEHGYQIMPTARNEGT